MKMKTEEEIRRELAVLLDQLSKTDKALVETRHGLLGCVRQLYWVLGDEERTQNIPGEWAS